MMQKTFINLLLSAILFCHVTTLNVVPGKSGEEQVKEALEKAQKESDEAAGNDKVKYTIDREKLELKNFYEGGPNKASPATDLVSVLTKKFEEINKDHHSHGENANEPNFIMPQKFSQGNQDPLQKDSDSKMVLIANKLNNLMQKFQRKLGNQGSGVNSYLTKHGKLSSHPLQLSHKQSPLAQRFSEEAAQLKSIRGHAGSKADIDLSALRKALGLLHKGSEKTSFEVNDPTDGKTSYKEDTKLEDKLALEAEEEKKFSNTENYEYGGMGEGEGKGGSSGAVAATSATSLAAAFNPKDQASKEMQSYNELISSESNRELNQIQSEITKATQSSLGEVSVVGQKEHVTTESPDPSPFGGGSPGGPLGGIGNLDGVDSMSPDSGGGMNVGPGGYTNDGMSMKGAIDTASISPGGGSESFPGSNAANEALEASLRASANADMNGESMPSDNEQTQSPDMQQGM